MIGNTGGGASAPLPDLPFKWRPPYVSEGLDGAVRSAQIDREEAGQYEANSVEWNRCMASAFMWDEQADRLRHPWSLAPHMPLAKRRKVTGPGDVVLYLDTDDVDEDQVTKDAERMVEILNERWAQHRYTPAQGKDEDDARLPDCECGQPWDAQEHDVAEASAVNSGMAINIALRFIDNEPELAKAALTGALSAYRRWRDEHDS